MVRIHPLPPQKALSNDKAFLFFLPVRHAFCRRPRLSGMRCLALRAGLCAFLSGCSFALGGRLFPVSFCGKASRARAACRFQTAVPIFSFIKGMCTCAGASGRFSAVLRFFCTVFCGGAFFDAPRRFGNLFFLVFISALFSILYNIYRFFASKAQFSGMRRRAAQRKAAEYLYKQGPPVYNIMDSSQRGSPRTQ